VSPVSEVRAGPKRSLLAQGRSRDTRQAIIKAALELWAERGYGTGIDDTTAEEIAARAGVAKATFYFHFARKDDILLETGWLTARVFYEDALKALIQDGPVLSEARASAPPPRGRSASVAVMPAAAVPAGAGRSSAAARR
jgi:tetracycline repressor-like protein